MALRPHSVVLFQGNSITDAGRDRSVVGPNRCMGSGYVGMITTELLAQRPEDHLQFYNRGLGGNTITDLRLRWERDTLHLLPDMLSILIGINDLWYRMSDGEGQTPERFKDTYQALLEATVDRLPTIKLVLCEPFALKVNPVTRHWMAPLAEMQETTRGLAEEYQAHFIPFQSALDDAAAETPPGALLVDGVHPIDKGHRLLARCWMEHVLDEGAQRSCSRCKG